MKNRLAHTSPGTIIFLSILATIGIGTALLALPFARTQAIPLVDLIFTVTSATCVTGLLTIPMEHFTTFGQSVILILIQIGGLGLLTLTLAILSFFVELGYSTQVMANHILELESWQNIRKLITFIFALTLCVELALALCTFVSLSPTLPIGSALFSSVFHAVSSFCNAGFSVLALPLTEYPYASLLLCGTMLGMFIGGLGFVTCQELMHAWCTYRSKQRIVLSLQSKISLYASLALVLSGTLLFLALEHDTIHASSSPLAFLDALFNVVSYRSTGFSTIPFTMLHPATLLMIMALAFIGTAPASTGSGIKVTTFTLCLATIKATVMGRTSVDIRARRIPLQQVYKAFTIVLLGITWIFTTTFILLATQHGMNFGDLLFEAVSAYTTLGFSSGITPALSIVGKICLIFSMIIGRIGSFTLILAIWSARHSMEYSYPEERVMLS